MNRIYFTFKTWSWCYTTVLFIKTQDACFFSEMYVCVGVILPSCVPFRPFREALHKKLKDKPTLMPHRCWLERCSCGFLHTPTHTHVRGGQQNKRLDGR